MNKDRLNRYLNSVGKECFVTYFVYFNNPSIKNHEIVEILKKEKDYTEKACNSRTGHARMIIREGGAKMALELIIHSGRLENEVRLHASELLKSIT